MGYEKPTRGKQTIVLRPNDMRTPLQANTYNGGSWWCTNATSHQHAKTILVKHKARLGSEDKTNSTLKSTGE